MLVRERRRGGPNADRGPRSVAACGGRARKEKLPHARSQPPSSSSLPPRYGYRPFPPPPPLLVHLLFGGVGEAPMAMAHLHALLANPISL
eukprot:2861182-Prymnesium_polylepis.1